MQFTEKVYNDNIKMIAKIANEYVSQNEDIRARIGIEELMSEGVLALANACNKFQEGKISERTGKPINFSTYAYTCIRNQMAQFIRENIRPVKISQNTNKKIIKVVNDAKAGMSTKEIAEKEGLKVAEVVRMMGLNEYAYSLNYVVDSDEGKEMLFEETVCNPEKEIDYAEILQLIFNDMPYSKTEKEIYCQMKGILGFDKINKTDLAARYGFDRKAFEDKYREAAKKIEDNIRKNYYLYS